ncbi:MAG: acyl-CoA/acyl-ACP dehydrogenase, partial [Actinomycetota bacterium]|nr:acyl-CoA/acyl-ACP dehydrogenase [Actinomycetota bacterium]
MDFSETPEQAMLREAVGKIAADFGHEYYAAKSRSGEKSTELWDALASRGYLGVNVAEAYGGGGMGIAEIAIVCEEVAAKGCPLLLLLVSPAICSSIIGRFGTEEQHQRWMPRFATAELKMAFAITEPDAGSNSHRIATTASRDGELYKLRGTKYYISGVDESESILVVARTGVDEGTGRARLSLFVVPTDAPGLERTVIPVEIVAPEKQFTLFFDNVEVPAENLVGTEGDGLRQVFHGLNPERITGAAIANGIGRYSLDKAAAYARERTVWDVPIGAHQGLSHPLAKAKVEVELARLMTQRAAWLYDNGLDAAESANMAKYASAEASLAALDQAIQTHGGNGLA